MDRRKRALLGDSTHSVADMIVGRLMAFIKTHFDGTQLPCLVEQNQVSCTLFPRVAVGVIHLGFHAVFGQA